MARHGRHSARRAGTAPGDRAPRTGAAGRLRYLLLTPHFMVGLGVVGVAVAAYAGTHTYLDFHAGPDEPSGCTGSCQHSTTPPPASALAGRPGDPTPEAASRSQSPGAVRVAQRASRDGHGGFHAVVTLTNAGSEPVHNWQLTFTYPDGSVRAAAARDGVRMLRAGASPVLSGVSGGRTLAPGETIRVRLTGDGVPTAPYACRVNGTTCQIT